MKLSARLMPQSLILCRVLPWRVHSDETTGYLVWVADDLIKWENIASSLIINNLKRHN